ncbi:LysR family transcriptional regulator [Pelagibius sp.]|uniref:LysR family transcriptional regulator n=1 Tax=Pelagibius sp. TaxID=1931238 RepID=UPI0026300B24|nr:LysR family transcriptional regulator [Pelagibius sp.]
MKPSPYQITAFTAAARERSFSKAAESLGVTQSSITQHVAKLEKIMGTLLFVRRRDGLELTPAAEELFQISDRLRTLEQLVDEKVASYGALSDGHLRIIANAPRPALPVIAAYTRLYPQVRIEFSLYSWTIAMQKLHERDMDIAIITEPQAVEGVSIHEINQTPYKAHLRRDHPLADRKVLSLHDLAEETVIMPEDGSFTQRVVSAKTREHGIELVRVIKTSTFPVVKEAVLHGVGVGIVLEDSLFPSRHLVTVPLKEMPEVYRHCLVTPPYKQDLRLVRSFLDVALQ